MNHCFFETAEVVADNGEPKEIVDLVADDVEATEISDTAADNGEALEIIDVVADDGFFLSNISATFLRCLEACFKPQKDSFNHTAAM